VLTLAISTILVRLVLNQPVVPVELELPTEDRSVFPLSAI
jgi:hypothetical protein